MPRIAGDDADGHLGLVERRSLLDVEFDEGGDAREVDQRAAQREPRRFGPGLAHVEGERKAGVAVLEREIGLGQPAEQCRGTEVGLAEPRALLGPQRQHDVVAQRSPGASSCRRRATTRPATMPARPS